MCKFFLKLFLYTLIAISSIFHATMLCMHTAASSSQRAKPKKMASLNVRDLYDAIERNAPLEIITDLIRLLRGITGGLHLALQQPRGPQRTTVLHLAVKNRRRDIVLTLLKDLSAQSINAPDLMGNTALHYAAETNDSFLIAELLKHNASATVKNILGDTPLHMLVKKHIETEDDLSTMKACILLLLGANADINAKNYAGNSPLLSMAPIQTTNRDAIGQFLTSQGALP